MRLFYIDGDVNCFETDDESTELIGKNSYCISAEYGYKKSLEDFVEISNKEKETGNEATICTNCTLLLNQNGLSVNKIWFYKDMHFTALHKYNPEVKDNSGLVELFIAGKINY